MEGREAYFVGVDVGTGSVRAALFNAKGVLNKMHQEKINIYNPHQDYYEQSSTQIWEGVCKCVKRVCEDISDKSAIKGIGFDATCSLVVLDDNFQPLSVSPAQEQSDSTKRDIIMWMDHRAHKEANFINSKGFSLLKYVGGKVSLEMQMPKILWIKNNLRNVWQSAAHYFCLPDFLTFKATGNTTRSVCSLVCKWNYLIDDSNGSWDDDYLCNIGLQSLTGRGHEKLGMAASRPGERCGYLDASVASSMGLGTTTAVSISMIDAYAGGLGLLASKSSSFPGFTRKLGMICGTSTCHMSVSKDPLFIEGIWGPFLNAMVPDMWLHEGGQSATGSLVDHVITNYSADGDRKNDVHYSYLDKTLSEMAGLQELGNVSFLTKDLHVYPDFHGNRSPLADPSYRGMMCGLTLDSSIEALALKYLATLQALTYGTKDVVDKMVAKGQTIEVILMCGGLSKCEIFVQLQADVLDRPVMIPYNKESVLLGAAMLGACASAHFGVGLVDIAPKMGSDVKVFMPCPQTKRFHEKKYEVFKLMQANWKSYHNIMNKI